MPIDRVAEEAFQIVVKAVDEIVGLVGKEVPGVDIDVFRSKFCKEVFEEGMLHDYIKEILDTLLCEHAVSAGESMLRSLRSGGGG